MSRQKIVILISVASFFLFLIGFPCWIFFSSIVASRDTDTHSFKIKMGTSYGQIIDSLIKQSIIPSDFKPNLVSKLLGLRHKLKAGKYRLVGGMSSYALLQQFVNGKVTYETITIPEGFTSRQIASLLKRKVEIDSVDFMQLVNDTNFVKQLAIEANSVEGFLFPETYRISWGMSPKAMIRLLVKQFEKKVTDSLLAKTNGIGLSLLETITLASIIEGEAVLDSEREVISAVYHNRLRKGILLRADPTIQYVIPDGPRRLLNSDLRIDSPYNTYKYSGLPPGPIGNPGLASIKASLQPADVNYLYFVANGDGSHTFSRTLKEHLKAKARFDRYRKLVSEEKDLSGRQRLNQTVRHRTNFPKT